MKTVRKTILLFVVFLLGSYFSPHILNYDKTEPIVIPDEMSSDDTEEAPVLESSDLKQSLVPATGFSNYIGLPGDDFIVDHGEPVEIKSITDNTELWVYGTDSTDYVQVKVTNYVITTILVMGSEIDVSPFKIGMELASMYQVASFHPNFEIPYENQFIQVDLNENELTNQPLVAFDNQTYAILTLDVQTQTLVGIHYMNNESLVYSGMYEITPFSSLIEENVVQINQAAQQKVKTEQTVQLINVIRDKFGEEPLEYSLVLSSVGNELYDFHEETLEGAESSTNDASQQESRDDALVINDEAAVEVIEESGDSVNEDATEEQENETGPNLLDENTIQAFLSEKDIQLDNVRLLYQTIEINPSIYVLEWFTLPAYRDILMDSSMERIGISYRNNELLLIFDDGSEINL